MPMLFSEFNAVRAPRAATLLALAALLTACKAPNPLMEEPAPVAKESRPAPAPAQTAATPSAVPAPTVQTPPPAAAAPAAPAPAQAAAQPAPTAQPQPAPVQQAAAPAGVQTTNDRRFFGIFSPYRPDIQQGNFVSREMLAQLKQGMTPDQVRFVLGTPLLNDLFHANRWDYVFRLQKGSGEVTTSRVALFFKDNRLSRIESGELPDEKEYLARLAGNPPETKSTAPSAVPAEAAKAAAPSTAAPK